MNDENTNNVPDQDAQQVDATTTPDSSAADQTAQKPDPAQTESQAPETGREVPEVNRYAERARKAEKELERLQAERQAESQRNQPAPDPQVQMVKDQLKQLGFVTREEQQAELTRREEDNRVANELNRLEGTYNGKDGRPQFDRREVIDFALEKHIGDLETAYEKLHQQQLIDWHVKQAIAGSRGVKTEASDGSGSQEVGTTDSDLKDAIAKGDKTALHTFLKRYTPKG